MYKFGRITDYHPDTKTAVITYERPDACAKCGACGTLNGHGSIELPCEAEIGSWVRIAFPERHFLGGAAIAYLIPLALLIGGLLLGYFLSNRNELIAMCAGLFGVLLSLLILWAIDKQLSQKSDWSPYVDCVYDEKPEMDEIGCPSH